MLFLLKNKAPILPEDAQQIQTGSLVQILHLSGHIGECGLLAEDECEIVFGLLLMPQVFETESFQEAQQTLVVYGELSPCQTQSRTLGPNNRLTNFRLKHLNAYNNLQSI